MDALVRLEQIKATLINHKSTVWINCGVGALTMLRFRGRPGIEVWFILICATSLLRFLWSCYVLRDSYLERFTARSIFILNVGTLWAGIVWVAVPIFFIQVEGSDSPFVVFVICGLTTGSIARATSYYINPILFVGPPLIALTLRYLMFGGFSGSLMATAAILFLVSLITSGVRAQASFCAALNLKFEAFQANELLFELANHDPLTGLLNRAAFALRLNALVEDGGAEPRPFSLFLLDLDRFKSINDMLGHQAGDDVLKEVGRRLRLALDSEAIIGRLGGDEFAIIVPGHSPDIVPTAEEADAGAGIEQRIAVGVSGPFNGIRGLIMISLSLGAVRYPSDSRDPHELFAFADLALYAAKGAGRQCHRYFERHLLSATEMARDLERDLPIALESGGLEVWYQPQVALTDGRLVGLEALLRWNHPRYGWVAPPSIVAAAWRTRQSRSLTAFVLSRACATLRRLQDEGGDGILIAINISPSELGQYDLAALIAQTIRDHGVDATRLELEITEESLVSGDEAVDMLRVLSDMGVRIAIDDFGTGYSSIGTLRGFRFDRVKLDQSFITGFAERKSDRIMVQGILGMMRSLGIDVVAEGIEVDQEAQILRGFGCPVGQGYLFGRPASLKPGKGWLDALTLGDRYGADSLPVPFAAAEAAA